MVTHADILHQIKQLDPTIANFHEQNQVFVNHMKIINACMLEMIPHFSVGSPFFPSVDQLTMRLAESYCNHKIAATLDEAKERANADRKTILSGIQKAFDSAG